MTYMFILYTGVTISQCMLFGFKVIDWYNNISVFINIISFGIFVILRLAMFYTLV